MHLLRRTPAAVGALFAAITGAVIAVIAVVLVLAPAGAETVAPDPSTIVDVTGDRDNGFSIYHLDGSSEHPPTISEARAECSEYSTRRERIRCRAEVRTWYRDLADLQETIAYYRSRMRT